MTFLSFSVYVQLLLISFSLTTLLSTAAGAPLNATIRLDSPLVSFTPGWRMATFGKTGQQFAFADGQNEELQVSLPQNTTAVFYQGFTIAGGALYFACIDCSSGAHTIVVDAHDDTETGTQPPRTLFSFTDLDPTVTHSLTVVNLEDDRFKHTSQITFDSLIMTIGALDNSTSTSTTSTDGGIGGIPTITATARHGPNQSDTASSPSTTAGQSSAGGVTGGATTTAPSASGSQATNSQTTSATATSGTEATVTGTGSGTQPTGTSQATQTQSTTAGSSATDSNGSGGTSQTPSPTGSSGSGTAGASQTAGGSTSTGGAASGSSGATASATGGGTGAQSTAGSSSNTSSAATGSGTSAPSNNGAAPSGGVSRTVIIVVAVIASLVVLSLLAAIVWLLLRSQPPPTDPEGGANGLMREVPATAIISGPIGLAPMRPQNPFADTVPANIPIDELSPVDEVLAAPPPRAPPAIPPKSPLRVGFAKPPAPWISRVPRTPSPTSPIA
ncbi:hypothetical protein L227DRAFT_651373 [Lentinus tigrinus ALCF2SS1-6]|uniref:Uncharacterized protein n=1 Tax=Lentinus tigrinus ALCF2SS1-6 TaxID=1328759 RepID=A0A5C2SH59_9APHY|nr:hypothetical protein L227DRAFT_651373 [Lentinus tigrinus ALCF2SS1-6]